MSVVDTLRPTAVTSSTGWTTTPSGTAAAVTSDDSDATYTSGQLADDSLVLSVGPHGVPANHRRHIARTRARGRDGQITASVRLPSGSGSGNVAFSGIDFGETGAFVSVNGSWGGGLPPTASGDFGITVTVESTTVDVDIAELYVDIDSRAQPTYDPQVSDGMTVTTTITTTSAPTVEIINVDTDSLPVGRWRAWVTLQGNASPIWDSGSVEGNPVPTQTDPLENDAYTLHVQLWSILGDDSEYAGVEETLDFTVNLVPVAPPTDIQVIAVADTPLFEIIATMPNSFADYDTEPFVEFQRSACGGGETGEWVTIALTGPATVTGTASYVDWTAPRTLYEIDCVEPTVCEFSYRVRLVGTQDGLLVTSVWLVEEVVLNDNPYFETDVTDWFAIGGTITHSTAQAYQGTGSALLTPDGVSATARIQINTFEPVTDLAQYSLTAWVFVTTTRSVSMDIAWYDGAQVFTTTSTASTSVILANTWTRVHASWIAPATTGFARPRIYMTGTPAASVLLYVDAAEFTSSSVPVHHSLEWPTADILLRTEDGHGALWLGICGTVSWEVDKPFTAQLGVLGGQQVTSGAPGDHDLTLSLAVETQAELETLEQILERQLILVSPSDSAAQWSAPSSAGVQILTIRGSRTIAVPMIGTGAEPAHEPGEVLE